MKTQYHEHRGFLARVGKCDVPELHVTFHPLGIPESHRGTLGIPMKVLENLLRTSDGFLYVWVTTHHSLRREQN